MCLARHFAMLYLFYRVFCLLLWAIPLREVQIATPFFHVMRN